MKKSEKVGLNLKALLLDHDLEMLNTLTQKLIGLGMDIESSDSLHRARMLFKQDPMKAASTERAAAMWRIMEV